MRKFLLFALNLTVCFSLSAQIPGSIESIHQNTRKTEYKRQFSLADSGLFSNWSNGAWQDIVLRTYSYNANDEVIQSYEKSPLSNELLNKISYSYDVAGNLLLAYTETYTNGNLTPQLRQSYVFDNKGNRTSSLTEQYNGGSQTWTILYGDSMEFTYDSKDRITSYIMYSISNQSVNPYQKLIWEDFGNDDLPKTLTVQTYVNGFNNYIKLDQMTWAAGFDYANFDPTSYFGYLWDGNSQSWTNSVYDTSLFDGNLRIQKLLFSWNGSTIDSLQKTDIKYDAQGHAVEDMTFSRVGQGWTLADGNRDSIVYGFDNVTLERYFSYYDKSTDHWINKEKRKYYYNSLSIAPVVKNEISVFPNPASDYVYLENTDLEIQKVSACSMLGKQFKLNIQDGKIQVSELEKGVYLLRIESTDGLFTSRIIIQ